MKLDERILERLDELVISGEQVLKTRRPPPVGVLMLDDPVDTQLAFQWATSVENILVRAFGVTSVHYKKFSEGYDKISYGVLYAALGILKAARDDFRHEQLFEVRQLIEAEVFDDFLQQAQHLLDAGYPGPSAVIAGCVLEDGLRKTCHRKQIAFSEKSKLDGMNSDLAKAGQYSKLVQKRITALADLRNKAAHGQWDQFGKDDVKEMLHSVRRIMSEDLVG